MTAVLRRSLWLILCSAAAWAQSGIPDPKFAEVPFDQWLAQGDMAQIPWKVQTATYDLSVHQRLHVRARIEVDGKELVKRKGRGEFLFLVQFRDRDGHPYQTHNSLKLDDVTAETSRAYMECLVDALVVPGEYRVDLVLLDTISKDHSVAHRTLRVEPLKNDPLPETWTGLPAVEFLGMKDGPPERWFQPNLSGRLHLPLRTRRPVHIELLVNVTPSEQTERQSSAYNLSMGFLLPAAKAISQIDVGNGSLDVALLDLSRQKVTFEQENVRELDWPQLSASFKEADPNKIDVRSLQNREHNAEFFVREMSRRIESAGGAPDNPATVFILLSAPMAFASGDAPYPVQPSGNRNHRFYYIRYSWAAEVWHRAMRDPRVFRRPPRSEERRVGKECRL